MAGDGIFISYNSADSELAAQLCEVLEQKGVTVWFAPKSIQASEHYAGKITVGIERCALVILIASESAIGDRRRALSGSKEVVREVQLASDRNKKLLVIKVDGALDGDYDEALFYLLRINQWHDIREFNDRQRQLDSVVFEAQRILSVDQNTHAVDASILDQEKKMDQIELSLVRNDLHAVNDLLDLKKFTPGFHAQFNVLEVFASLLKVGLFKNLDKAVADNMVSVLKKTCEMDRGQYAAICWCLMANLAKKYYDVNGLHNPGFDYMSALGLYRSAKSSSRITHRQKMILKNIKDSELL